MKKDKIKILKDNCQIRYVLEYARVTCPICRTRHSIYPEGYMERLKDFVCDTCGELVIMPSHYIDTYHNKRCKVIMEVKQDDI